MTPLRSRHLEIADARVTLSVSGPPTSAGTEPVVLLHGAGMDRTVWRRLQRSLGDGGHPVVAPDLPGHGLSDGSPRSSIGDLAEWVTALIGGLDVDRIHLVGHSLGSLVALQAAASYPDRVRSLVMIAAAESMPVNPRLQAEALTEPTVAAARMARWCHARDHDETASRIESTYLLLVSAPTGALATDLAACSAYEGSMEAIRRRACPTLLVLGGDDVMAPPQGATRLAEAAGVSSVTIDGAGHMVMTDHPDRVATVVAEFIERATGNAVPR